MYKIENILHKNFEYVKINFYILKKLLYENKSIVYFKQEIYIINNFCINILLETNIFKLRKIVINIKREFINFLFCEKLKTFQFLLILSLKNDEYFEL